MIVPLALSCLLAFAGPGAGAEEDAAALNADAVKLIDEGKLDPAIDKLEEAVRLAPKDDTIRGNLAAAHNNRGLKRLDEMAFGRAVNDFEDAIRLCDKEPLFRVHLGYTHLKRYDFARAEAALEETRRLFPDYPKSYHYLGFLYYSNDELDKAIAMWTRRLELEDDAWTRAMLDKAKREQAVSAEFTDKSSNDFVLKFLGDEKTAGSADAILSELEDARAAVGSDLGYFPQRRTIVLLYTNEDFKRATGAHDWVGGLYDGKIRLQVRDLERQRKNVRSTIRHEYTHRVLDEMAPGIPVWLNEGIAEWMGNAGDVGAAHAEARAMIAEGVPLQSFADMPKSFTQQTDAKQVRAQYAASLSFVAFLRDRYGLGAMRALLFALRDGQDIDQAMNKNYGGGLKEMEQLWRTECLR